MRCYWIAPSTDRSRRCCRDRCASRVPLQLESGKLKLCRCKSLVEWKFTKQMETRILQRCHCSCCRCDVQDERRKQRNMKSIDGDPCILLFHWKSSHLHNFELKDTKYWKRFETNWKFEFYDYLKIDISVEKPLHPILLMKSLPFTKFATGYHLQDIILKTRTMSK